MQLLRNTTASGNPARVRRSDSIPCDLPDYDILASEVFAVDWETRDHPRRVFRRDADKYYYGGLLGKTWNHTPGLANIKLMKAKKA